MITRFAPSPTGKVHIGNIRTAIFNWLYARHNDAKFILRIEDTDLERSTKASIDALFDCMNWLGLDYDGTVLYQSKQIDKHLKCVENMKHTYKLNGATYFQIPYDCDKYSFIKDEGKITKYLNGSISISKSGVTYKDNVGTEYKCCLAGVKNLKVFDKKGNTIFDIRFATFNDPEEQFVYDDVDRIEYIRRSVYFKDLVKCDLTKPLDTINDFIIIRSDGTPVFHIANVYDDIEQHVTHIIRGDDHVENTYRHLFLFQELGAEIPTYAHLPMIVNSNKKPYSKRDGDAFVGEFREKGFFPEVMFNYLALIGWTPDKEIMSKKEMIEKFDIKKVHRCPGEFNLKKLISMNRKYILDMDKEMFAERAFEYSKNIDWMKNLNPNDIFIVAKAMKDTTTLLSDMNNWKFFFYNPESYDEKGFEKYFSDPKIFEYIKEIYNTIDTFKSIEEFENYLRMKESSYNLKNYAFNQPLRLIISGVVNGIIMTDIFRIIKLDNVKNRIKIFLEKYEK